MMEAKDTHIPADPNLAFYKAFLMMMNLAFYKAFRMFMRLIYHTTMSWSYIDVYISFVLDAVL